MDKFSPKHIGFVLVGVTVISLKTYPTIFNRNGGRDTWMAMIVASLVILLYLFFVVQVFRKSNFSSLNAIYESALGKWLGNFLLFFFFLTLLMTLVESASIEANAMHVNMLMDTPSWIISLFFIPPALYNVKRGIGAVMAMTVIAIVLVSISGTNLAMLTVPYKHYGYLKPFLGNGITSGLIISMLQILGLFGCFAIVFPYISLLGDRTGFTKWLIIAMIFVIQMEIIAETGTLMTFDIDFANTMSYPKLLQTQLISEFRFLEFGELFVMLQMVGGWFIKYILTFYAVIKLVESRVKIKYLQYWVSIIVFVITYFLSEDLFLLFKFLNLYTFICLINFVIIPFIVFLIYSLRGCPSTEGK